MELLGDVGHMESLFFPFGDSVSVGARLLHGLETMLVSAQDRCTVCAKRAIGLEIILDAPDGNPR